MSLTSSAIMGSGSDVIGHVQDDLACAECGYNLRTLALDADCPECGMPVLISSRGDRLIAAPRGWLTRLDRGGRWLWLSVVLAFPIVYFGVAASCVGLWLLTAVQPGRTEPSTDRGYRMAARWATLAGGIALVAMTLGSLIYVAVSDQRLAGNWNMQWRSGLSGVSGEFPMFDMLFLTAHAVYVLGLLSLWRYLQMIALRVPDNLLADAWRRLAWYWIGAVAGLAMMSFGGFLLVRMGLVPGGSTSIWMPVVWGLVFAVVLTGLWLATLRVTGRQARVLREVLAQNI